MIPGPKGDLLARPTPVARSALGGRRPAPRGRIKQPAGRPSLGPVPLLNQWRGAGPEVDVDRRRSAGGSAE